MADSHLGPQLALAPPNPGTEVHQQPASAASLYSPLVFPGDQASQSAQSIQMFLPSPFAQPAGAIDQGPPAPAPDLHGPKLGMQANAFPSLPAQPAGVSSQGPNPQALMGVLGLLQQNIGALQALVPLLAGPQNQQQQQLLLQQQPQAGSGMVNTISQLASATASIIPQLGMAVQQQQQQQQQQQKQQQPLGPPAHAFALPAAPPHMQQPLRKQTEEPALKLMTGAPEAPSNAPAAMADRDAMWKQPRAKEPFGGSLVAEPKAPKTLVASPLDSGENEDGDENSPLDDDFPEENLPASAYDIVEMDPVEILAEHTHFCEICGKGFKRDANLRMHMRGHGDEYKTPSALARPDKPGPEEVKARRMKRFSCPYVGCKRNKQHRRFTPLKTMLCVKNHYRRSHCPKMLTCSKCTVKRFSVVADLRTHEKHCGKDRWLCSCGTSFSRKDKLLGHLALFTGHSAAAPSEGEDYQAPPLPASATSTSGGSRARDCISSTFNLNQPTGDDAEMEREVVVYERQSGSPKDPRNCNVSYHQRLAIRTTNHLS